jgi:hypothetical protein
MGPEMHYQVIIDRVSELHDQAAAHRRVREAERGRAARQGKSGRRYRSVFGKLRAS